MYFSFIIWKRSPDPLIIWNFEFYKKKNPYFFFKSAIATIMLSNKFYKIANLSRSFSDCLDIVNLNFFLSQFKASTSDVKCRILLSWKSMLWGVRIKHEKKPYPEPSQTSKMELSVKITAFSC